MTADREDVVMGAGREEDGSARAGGQGKRRHVVWLDPDDPEGAYAAMMAMCERVVSQKPPVLPGAGQAHAPDDRTGASER